MKNQDVHETKMKFAPLSSKRNITPLQWVPQGQKEDPWIPEKGVAIVLEESVLLYM